MNKVIKQTITCSGKMILIAMLAVTVLMSAVLSNPAYAASGTWKQNSKGWWYSYSDGTYPKGQWEKIGGKWYYFNSAGYMQTGWLKDGGKWYYLGTSGAMTTGWQKVSGKWYYMGTSGAMTTGWQKVSGKWYYMGTSGVMTTGWQKVSGKWYYMNGSGVMQTGWLKLSGKWYYLKSSGEMATGTVTIGGKTYKFDKNGVWIDDTADWRKLYLNAASGDVGHMNAALIDVDRNGIPELFSWDTVSINGSVKMYYINNGKAESKFLSRLAGVAKNKIYTFTGNMSMENKVFSYANGSVKQVFRAYRSGISGSGIEYELDDQSVDQATYEAAMQKNWTTPVKNLEEISYTFVSTKAELQTLLNAY